MKWVRCTGCGRAFDYDSEQGALHVSSGPTLEEKDYEAEFYFCGACRPKAEKQLRRSLKGATWMGNPN